MSKTSAWDLNSVWKNLIIEQVDFLYLLHNVHF